MQTNISTLCTISHHRSLSPLIFFHPLFLSHPLATATLHATPHAWAAITNCSLNMHAPTTWQCGFKRTCSRNGCLSVKEYRIVQILEPLWAVHQAVSIVAEQFLSSGHFGRGPDAQDAPKSRVCKVFEASIREEGMVDLVG